MFSYADPNGHAIKWLSFGAPVGQSAHLDRVCFDAVLAQSYNGNTIKLPSPLSRKNIFSVNAETGQLFLNSPILDYESTKLFSVMISVTDGQLSSFSTVLITVTDVSEPPIAIKRCSRDLSAHACGRVNENSPVGTPIGSTLEIIDQDSKSYFPGKSIADEECSASLHDSSLQITQISAIDLNRETDLTDSIKIELNDLSVPEPNRAHLGNRLKHIMNGASSVTFPDTPNSNFLIDMNKLTTWNSGKGPERSSIQVSFEEVRCY
jgi:hypothetical protein